MNVRTMKSDAQGRELYDRLIQDWLASPEAAKSKSADYDSIFKTLVQNCPRSLVYLVNHLFGERFHRDSNIVYHRSEFIVTKDGTRERRFADSGFTIDGPRAKRFHLECQATDDKDMLVRFFEYDSMAALDGAQIERGELYVDFPSSAVLYLRHTASTPHEMGINIRMPGGEAARGIVKVMKVQDYSADRLFGEHLWFLLPFLLFRHEKRLTEYEANPEMAECLFAEYREISSRLAGLVDSGEDSEQQISVIREMTGRAADYLAGTRAPSIAEGVRSIMGGEAFTSQIVWMLNRAKEIGNEDSLARGREEGAFGMVFDLVTDKLINPALAASRLNISEAEFSRRFEEYKRGGYQEASAPEPQA